MTRGHRIWRGAGLAIVLLALAVALPALRARSQETGEEADPPEVAIGERLFLETRFAQFFAARAGGDANAVLAEGDPVMETTRTTRLPLPGPFAGSSMNCRACHLVDEQKGVLGGGNRTYADFARRSPLPAREDGKRTTPRNAPPLVNASLDRPAFLLHFDGEFASGPDLVKGTLTGRNFGWLPAEQSAAIAHIARLIRHDDGTGDLAQQFGGAYRVVLKGTDPSIPPALRLPPAYRIDVDLATDQQILDAVAALIDAYVTSLVFVQDESGAFNGSPYDVFLRLNDLPRQPDPGESDLEYTRRLRALVDELASARFVTPLDSGLRGRRKIRFVTPRDGTLALLDQPFVFGPLELAGLRVFLREGPTSPTLKTLLSGGVGNCVSCHPAPRFTDFAFHNTGAAQDEYDAVHILPGSFMALRIPDLAERNANHDTYLPPTPIHPNAQGRFLDVPSLTRRGRTDLGAWNVFANPDMPAPQDALVELFCRVGPCDPATVLPRTIATFKTPGLRTLGMSAPYLHTGRATRLEDVLDLYVRSSRLARQGRLRNASPPLLGMVLAPSDLTALTAFLKSLNEDYE